MAPRLLRTIVVLISLAFAASSFAQFRGGFGGRVRPRLPTAASYDGGFNFCRGMYTSGRRDGSGNGWTTDYPDADINFSIRLSELTKTSISRQADGQPNHLTVPLTDPFLFQCPFLMMTDVGELSLSDAETEALRQLSRQGWLPVGGRLLGLVVVGHVRARNRRACCRQDSFRSATSTPGHPIFRMLYEIAKLPQIPSINSWRGMGGDTSELGDDSAEPHIRAISDRQGRMMVLMTHNTDISDAWEREAADPQFFLEFSPNGYAVGLNVVLYAITH